MKTTSLLKEEHCYILRALDIIDEMASRIADGEPPDSNDVESILKFLQFYGDSHHQEREEAVLFPALLKASDSGEYENLCGITFEHNRQRSLIEGFEEALLTHKGLDFVYYARRLSEVMRTHIKLEEEEVFRHADEILNEEADKCVVQELASYESPNQAGRLVTMLECLAAMETKYLTNQGSTSEKAHSV